MGAVKDIDEDDDEAVETDAKADVPADDEGEAVEAADDTDDDAADDAPADDKRQGGLEAGIAAERRKRQAERRRSEALERELAEVRGQLRGLTAGAQTKAEPTPEFDVGDMTGSAARIAAAKLTEVERAKFERKEAEWQSVVASCMDDARENHPDLDVDETVSEFVKLQMADATGRLSLRVRRAEDPVEFAIKYMERHAAKNGGGAKVKELEAKVAELMAKIEGRPAPPKKPQRIAGGRSASTKAGHDRDSDPLHGAFGR